MVQSAWKKYDETAKKKIFDFAEGYRKFMSNNKTERECVSWGVKLAEENGFKNIEEIIDNHGKLNPGDRVYLNHRGKNLVTIIIGSDPIETGMNILGAHVDSPRIDIKPIPLYEDHNIAYLDTHYYGGIKSYQWVTMALALHGVVCKKDGTTVKVCIGEQDGDPVVGISDLLPHLAAKQMQKTGSSIIEAEDLNITIGNMPLESEDDKASVKEKALAILKEKYGIEEADFLSAEIEAVPAGPAKDYGLDSSMIMAYGQDDRICAYASIMAQLEVLNPTRTSMVIMADKEEIGSVGNTGSQSHYFEDLVSELVALTESESELKTRRALRHSTMLSNDVSVAFDPIYASVSEEKNTAFMGSGVGLNKYTGARGKGGASDANAEYLSKIRRIFDDADVSWQSNELGRVNEGGGGTIAYIFANYGMDVVDTGVPVQNMHAPYEVTSKVDLYEAFKAYTAFLKD